MVKLNNAEQYEPIFITLTESETPIAYQNKIEELVECGAYKAEEDAKVENPSIKIECEIYYEKGSGVFAVESGAVESGCVYSPYSGEECEEADDY